MKGSPVVLRRCSDYAECDAVIAQCMDASGLASDLRGARRVLLKPNQMRGTAEAACDGTHPAFVGALVRWARARGIEVVVGDASGLIGFTSRVLDASGVRSAALAAGARVLNLDDGPFRTLPPVGSPPVVFRVPEVLFEVDGVLQVPKVKTHSFMGLTLSLKNLVGVLPGATKPALHVLRPGPDELAGAILDLYQALERSGVRWLGSVVDGILALGGRGPGVGPRPARLSLVAAGRDLAAVDLACALAAGFSPDELPLCRAAISRAMGPASRDALQVDGPDPSSWGPPLVRPARDHVERTRLTTGLYYRVRERLVRPVVIPARCTGAGRCSTVCPVDAIHRDGKGRARIGRECIRCMACVGNCPEQAIRLHSPPVLRSLLRRRLDDLPVGDDL